MRRTRGNTLSRSSLYSTCHTCSANSATPHATTQPQAPRAPRTDNARLTRRLERSGRVCAQNVHKFHRRRERILRGAYFDVCVCCVRWWGFNTRRLPANERAPAHTQFTWWNLSQTNLSVSAHRVGVWGGKDISLERFPQAWRVCVYVCVLWLIGAATAAIRDYSHVWVCGVECGEKCVEARRMLNVCMCTKYRWVGSKHHYLARVCISLDRIKARVGCDKVGWLTPGIRNLHWYAVASPAFVWTNAIVGCSMYKCSQCAEPIQAQTKYSPYNYHIYRQL